VTLKVLLSGFTAQQIGNGTILKYGPVVDLFAAALRDAGVQVDHRRCEPGMSLKEYDAVIIGQAPLHGLPATYAYGALDVIRRARAEGCGLLFYIDDWQVGNLKAGISTVCRGPWRLTKDLFSTCRKDFQWAKDNLDDLMIVVEAMRDRPWPKTLVPKFEWGDGSLVTAPLNSREFVYVDPSSYADEYDTVVPSDTTRYAQWVLGILSDQRPWTDSLALSWPIRYIGSKKSRAPRPVPEPDLVQLYAQSWGVLSPPYPAHAGSGWWRNRFVYAARTGSIMLADQREAGVIGDAYTIDPGAVEKMNILQLREVADAQRAQLEKWQWPKEQVQERILRAVTEAIAEVKT